MNYFNTIIKENIETAKQLLEKNYTKDTVFILGDRHVDIFSKNTFSNKIPLWQNNDIEFVLFANMENAPKYIVYHIGPCTAYKTNSQISSIHSLEKTNFLIENGFLPKGATIATSFGEIDCRVHILKLAKEKNKTPEEIIDDVIKNYGEYLLYLKVKGYNVVAYGPVASQSDFCEIDPNFPRYGTEIERNKVLEIFNKKTEMFCKEHSIGFKTIFYNLINEDMSSKKEYYLETDHVHLSNNAYPMLENLFSDIKPFDTQIEKIAICMPIYNTEEKYLKEAIKSVLEQTYQDFKLYIYDDGSDVDYKPVIEEFKSQKIVYFRNEQHNGVSYARNQIIDVIESKYIRFMDSDDIMPKDALEKQIKYLEDNSNVGILGGTIKIIDSDNICKFPRKVSYLDMYTPKLQTGATMMRTKPLKDNNIRFPLDMLIAGDCQFFNESIQIMQMENLEDIMLEYRILPHSVCHKDISETEKCLNMVQKRFLNFLTLNERTQEKIVKVITNPNKKKKNTIPTPIKYKPLEKIFSVKNQYLNKVKHRKIVTLLGIKMKFRVK